MMHFKCRNGLYPRTQTSIIRQSVPDDKVSWDIEWPEYNPPNFTSEHILNQSWADPEMGNRNFKPLWNEMDGKISRISFHGNYSIEEGVPLNPIGRTGLRGRGILGRWGPNHAADPIITRWKKVNSIIISDYVSQKPVLQFVAIKRRDCNEWAIPGGMVDPGEKVTSTLKREFLEEALNSLEMSSEQKSSTEKKIEEFFSLGEAIYTGYVDDIRNTDNAWMETTAYNFHDGSGNFVGSLNLNAGDDAIGVTWLDLSRNLPLYASHSMLLELVSRKQDAHWWCFRRSRGERLLGLTLINYHSFDMAKNTELFLNLCNFLKYLMNEILPECEPSYELKQTTRDLIFSLVTFSTKIKCDITPVFLNGEFVVDVPEHDSSPTRKPVNGILVTDAYCIANDDVPQMINENPKQFSLERQREIFSDFGVNTKTVVLKEIKVKKRLEGSNESKILSTENNGLMNYGSYAAKVTDSACSKLLVKNDSTEEKPKALLTPLHKILGRKNTLDGSTEPKTPSNESDGKKNHEGRTLKVTDTARAKPLGRNDSKEKKSIALMTPGHKWTARENRFDGSTEQKTPSNENDGQRNPEGRSPKVIDTVRSKHLERNDSKEGRPKTSSTGKNDEKEVKSSIPPSSREIENEKDLISVKKENIQKKSSTQTGSTPKERKKFTGIFAEILQHQQKEKLSLKEQNLIEEEIAVAIEFEKLVSNDDGKESETFILQLFDELNKVIKVKLINSAYFCCKCGITVDTSDLLHVHLFCHNKVSDHNAYVMVKICEQCNLTIVELNHQILKFNDRHFMSHDGVSNSKGGAERTTSNDFYEETQFLKDLVKNKCSLKEELPSFLGVCLLCKKSFRQPLEWSTHLLEFNHLVSRAEDLVSCDSCCIVILGPAKHVNQNTLRLSEHVLYCRSQILAFKHLQNK